MKMIQVKVPESLSERDVKLAAAIEAFSRGSVTAERAAEIAGLSLRRFDEARARAKAPMHTPATLEA